MTLPQLATLDDVAAIVGRDLTPTERSNGNRLLDMASGMVRRYTRQKITQVVDEVVTLPGNWTNILALPDRPVTSVKSVLLNGNEFTGNAWVLAQDALFVGTGSYLSDYGSMIWGSSPLWGPAGSNQGPQTAGPSWQGPQSKLTVTYTHGYAEVPWDIINEVAGMVALQLSTSVGVNTEQIGGYKVGYVRGEGGGMGLTAEAKSVLNFYRKRATTSSIAALR